jgi:hypothetical protein
VLDVGHSTVFGQIGPQRPKRLVEECFGVDVRCVQRRFGKEVLLRAIRRCEPIDIPIPYNRPFEVWLPTTPTR